MTVFIFLILVLILVAGMFFLFFPKRSPEPSLELVKEINMEIISPAFGNYQAIPKKYTCDGEDISPPLEIRGVPAEAKSLVLIFDDPDSSSGNFTHWLVWNIDVQTKEINENSVPAGAVLGLTDFGQPGYGGPCPGSGVHRYFFRLYALDAVLGLPEGAGKSALEKAMENHILARAELIGRYGRNQGN
ncbi:MAG: YbhB/YbcL family Raf kinase inhibitor-like protein [Candidatus Paceibacterota bacterium]